MDDKVKEILEQKKDKVRKELETMNGAQLHELFLFFYQLNYKQCCIVTPDRFTEFLESFDLRVQNDSQYWFWNAPVLVLIF